MKINSYHYTALDSYTPSAAMRDNEGYITNHDSPYYVTATEKQLARWADSPFGAVHNAAVTEQAERLLRVWQEAWQVILPSHF